jgi:acyl dehydratase
MSINFDVIGVTGKPRTRSWTSDEALLYAVSVGAGQYDPSEDLAFTTENSAGVEQRVLPTFAVLLGSGGGVAHIGDIDPAKFVHGGQSVTLHRPIPIEGAARATSTVAGIYDKGSGALVVSDVEVVDDVSGESLATLQQSLFIRGEGGFGGAPQPAEEWSDPAGPPDESRSFRTSLNQALVYRLNGDRNPLHADPAFAARAGFKQPILHGLCTFGITGRLLANELGERDSGRLRSMHGRFTHPVIPGEELTVQMWRTDDGARFRTLTEIGEIALDRGRFSLGEAA